MSKYVLITEIKKQSNQEREFYQDKFNKTLSVKLFETFDEAYAAMRATITEKAETCKFFPWKRKKYVPLADTLQDCYWEDPEDEPYASVAKINEIVKNTINDVNYYVSKPLLAEDVDDADWYFAYVSDKNGIVVDHYSSNLKLNVHFKRADIQEYYFIYTYYSEDVEDIVNGITIRLLKIDE